ncbi:glycosyltransferase family 4 protein [Azorhizobium doebereinerae]|uniref:glycosyltransferase family 4 protein n=1 Tax=Azorhizobium doebereinerae TaxID=281091 RepID=UPI000417A595|nr:glycosyltransferase family 4 protein [Azorhizobium doebereinerae]
MSARRGGAPIRVFVDTPRWFIRPRNTDWRYMNGLARLEEHVPVRMIYGASLADAAQESLHYLGRRLAPARPADSADYARSGAPVAAAARGADLVLSHRRFPLGLPQPVVWHYAVLDPQMQGAAGVSPQEVEAQYAGQEPLYARAARVQVPTQAEAARHAARFPHLAARFVPCPFFLPHITPITDDALRAKHGEDARLAVSFVGRAARRKGLDLVLEAIAALPVAERRRIDLSVVSPERPAAPGGLTLRHIPSATPREVQALMAASHVFLMPSRFESFGFTLIEAMAQGCAVIGPDGEVQREILAEGAAGCPVGADAGAVSAALLRLMADRPARLRMASAALARYHACYRPEVVARRHLDLFARALS